MCEDHFIDDFPPRVLPSGAAGIWAVALPFEDYRTLAMVAEAVQQPSAPIWVQMR